jgi:hypothetical protein
MQEIMSSVDVLLLGLIAGEQYLGEVIAGITPLEYEWEPLTSSEKASDLPLPAERKKVWRVFERDGVWVYDYAMRENDLPAFTTIAWLMNHIAQTADMYLYCIRSMKPAGVERSWDDLPVHSSFEKMAKYMFETLGEANQYLSSIPAAEANQVLNKMTPAPWGELRPAYINLWGGVIEHVIHHTAQIAARKDRIRFGH